jgi:hypothetical protein
MKSGAVEMAWTESFHCDVCDKEKSEASVDWWLAWTEEFAPPTGEQAQPLVKVIPWNNFVAHSADVHHLCGASCVHTMIDRWMAGD